MMMSSYSDAVVIRHPQPGAVAVSAVNHSNSATFCYHVAVILYLIFATDILAHYNSVFGILCT